MMGNHHVRFRGRGRGYSLRDPSPLPDEILPDDQDIAFGLADLGLGFPELGYVSLSEILNLRGRFGLPVEWDLYFRPEKTLSEYAEDAKATGKIVA